MQTLKNITKFTPNEIESLSYDIYLIFDDFFVAVLPMTFGKGRIIYSESLLSIENAWCYSSLLRATIAMFKWNPLIEQEPQGWFRNPIDGRRRTEADPAKEYTRL